MNIRTPLLLLVSLGFVVFGIAPATAEDAPPSPVAQADDSYSAEELMEIVGPIALYPDIVLSSVLPASTMPMDVVQAARWLEKQEGEVSAPPEDSGWDGSVEALIQFPDVLLWMNENLDWLEQLGYAVAVQQEDVLAAIQDFRAEAKDAGNLESNDKQEIVVTNENTIEVQPADPQIVYVPQYEPTQVVYASSGTSSATSFWTGVAVGAVGAWAVHSIRWGTGGGGGHYGGYGGGSINVSNNPTYNFNNSGNINRGNVGSGNTFKASSGRSTGRPANRPAGGAKTPKARTQNPSNRARTSKGGVKPGKNTGANRGRGGNGPSSSRPGGSRPGGASTRPSKAPGAGAGSGSRGGSSSAGRSQSKAKKSSGSSFGGAKSGGASAKSASSRGKSSQAKSRSSSGSRSSSSRSSGGSRGGSRGGGGGGRRR